MLKNLKLCHVGPAPSMELVFGQRLNLITGDNGLGKSFLLDIVWWGLTRKWPAEVNLKLTTGKMVRPRSTDQTPGIEFSYVEKSSFESYSTSYSFTAQNWLDVHMPINPGLVLYAMGDGGFAVFDPVRSGGNQFKKPERPPYVFNPNEIWDGLHSSEGTVLCNGLIRDWASWQRENGRAFQSLCAVLKALSPSEQELLTPGALKRISLDDARDIPSIHMPYGEEVPVVHASSGMRRVIALAYLLVWCWEEHVSAAAITRRDPSNQIMYLIDEVEAHLHPKWQRRILPALMEVMKTLNPVAQVQALVVTHSPLVMASVEPYFDAGCDAWFDLDFKPDASGQAAVVLEQRPFVRRGDAANWLMSPAFDLASARSLEAEQALQQAAIAMSDEHFTVAQAQALRARLQQLLGDTDPFWMRFNFVAQQKGWWQ
jgi:AAA domain, putative AbiEii toxin, Type IV TA system